jgi:hypothetical protein
MTQRDASSVTTSRNGAAERPFRPRSWNQRTRVRFLTKRRRYWLAQVSGVPSPRMIALADSIAQLEWSIAVCENQGDIAALRDLKEHIRLRDRLLDTFLKSLSAPVRKLSDDEITDSILGRGAAA